MAHLGIAKMYASFPVGLMCAGVSGQEVNLVNDTLLPHVHNQLNRKFATKAAPCAGVGGLENFDKVIDIDQNPIGRTPAQTCHIHRAIYPNKRVICTN